VGGNVRRVLSRLLDRSRPGARELEQWAAALVDPESPGEFNQALMELGSLVCTPRSPDCGGCPVAGECRARRAGTQEERPAPRSRGPVAKKRTVVVVLAHGRQAGNEVRFLLRRRPSEGLLGGMWEFPGVDLERDATLEEAASTLADSLRRAVGGGGKLGAPVPLPAVDHAFSHLEVKYVPFLQLVQGGGTEQEGGTGVVPAAGELAWVSRTELARLPVPVAQRKVLRHAETELAPLTAFTNPLQA